MHEARNAGEGRVLRGGQHRQNGAKIAVSAQAPSSAEDAVAILPQDLEVAIPICAGQSRWIQLPHSNFERLTNSD